MKNYRTLAVLLVTAAAGAFSRPSGAAPATGTAAPEPPLYGLAYMDRFDRLPELKRAVCRQVSSYDRSGGNGDAGHFLNGDAGKLPNDKALLADLKGPGCVYRLWSANAAGIIRFYFDGEAEPRIVCPMQDLFQERYPPFRKPLAGQSSGGWYSYLPIPYNHSLRIEVEHPGVMYYQVEYHTYPEATPVRSFTRELTPEDQKHFDAVVRQWTRMDQPPVGFTPTSERNGEATLSAGQKVKALSDRGSGQIRSFHVRISPATRYTLRNVVVRAYWDNQSTPAVEAPLGDFFGSGFGPRKFAAIGVRMQEDGFHCYYPMPYRKAARIELENQGTQPVQLSWDTQLTDLPAAAANYAYFHAKWKRVTTERGKHVTLLDTTGRGHFVGVNLNMQGDRGLGFLEGDEKIYVDGESFPSIYGTGTEDFFTSGWYFDRGTFSLPYHGCIVKDDPHSRISAYRYQTTECVPFQRSIRVDIEHGGTNDYPGADYAYTSYWYQDTPEDHWAPLPPAADRRPPTLVVKDAVEAESLRPNGARTITDENLDLELSRGQGVQADGVNPFTVTLDIPATGYYTIGLGVLKSDHSGKAWVSLDGVPFGDFLDAYSPNGASVERVTQGQTGSLSKGEHVLKFQPLASNPKSMGGDLILDYVSLRRQIHPGAIEAEQLKVLEHTAGVPLEPQGMEGFGPHWSGDRQLWFRPTKDGAAFSLELPVKTGGKYHLSAYFTKAIDYGQVQVSVDGQDVGEVFDGFHDGVVASGKVDLGDLDLSAGNHVIRFTVTGKNPRATSYMVGVDAIALDRVTSK